MSSLNVDNGADFLTYLAELLLAAQTLLFLLNFGGILVKSYFRNPGAWTLLSASDGFCNVLL
jgi:hypothetical protein